MFLLQNLGPQLRALVRDGHDVILVASRDGMFDRLASIGARHVIEVEIRREISPWHDLVALARLVLVFRRLRPDIVHSTTPKAGLLCAFAGRLAGVPVVLHTFTGQVWVTAHGLPRVLARMADRVITQLCTRCFADSASQVKLLEREGLAAPGVVRVLGDGSLSGVDLERFDRERLRSVAAETRAALKIPREAPVIVFVGRVRRDKGVLELLDAFQILRESRRSAVLVIVGPDEFEGDPEVASRLREKQPGVYWTGHQPEPERFVAMADVFCLPSYREGFPTVVLEAAALSVPSIGSDIPGTNETIIDGQTGLLVPVADPVALARALERLLSDPVLRSQFGEAARDRAVRFFSSSRLSTILEAEYRNLSAQSPPEGKPR